MKTVSIQVIGKVQGVWFRASTKKEAVRLGVNGFVKNQSDGSVYIEAKGTQASLDEFVSWCQHGPSHARVDQCKVEEISREGFHNFVIKR